MQNDKVHTVHGRLLTTDGVILPRGGVTVVAIQHGTNGEEWYAGCAVCSPKDNFCRKRGRLIAEGRAVAGLANGTKEQKAQTVPERFTKTPLTLFNALTKAGSLSWRHIICRAIAAAPRDPVEREKLDDMAGCLLRFGTPKKAVASE